MDHFKHSSVDIKLGEQILIHGQDGNVYRYDIETWTLRFTYDASGLDNYSSSIGGRILIDPDGDWFAVSSGLSIEVFDMHTGASLYSNATMGGLISMDSAATVICICDNSNIALVSTSTWTRGALLAHGTSLYSGTAFSPNDTYIASCGFNGTIRSFTWSGTTLTHNTSPLGSTGSYTNRVDWYNDNNFCFFNSGVSGGSDENVSWRETLNTVFGTNSREAVIDMIFYEYGAGFTSMKSICTIGNANPNSATGFRRVLTYSGATDLDAFTEDGASYPTDTVYGIALTLDKTRGFYAGRESSVLANLHEFNPATMEYVGEVIADIGDSGEDFFWSMATFNSDL